MKLSDNGLRLIRSFEGYHDRQADGSCKAYRCPAGVWTCGWGSTAGVTANTHWTEAEATERLAAEIAKFERAVDQLVTVPLNQNQFDALVSFAYNCGSGALEKSTLLKKTNSGNFEAAAREFPKWNKGGGRVLPGLVARRAREEALFLKPMEEPAAPIMPQAVAETKEVSKPTVAAAAAVATTAATSAIPPEVPEVLTKSLANAEAWKTVGETAWTFKQWAIAQPTLAAAVSLSAFGFYLWSKRKQAQ